MRTEKTFRKHCAGCLIFLAAMAQHGIDGTRLGAYAASANTTQSLDYLMSETATKNIKAAALFYGGVPAPNTTIRKDLPVLYILAEGDAPGPF